MRTAAPQPAPQSAGRARRKARRLHGHVACTGGQAPYRVSGPRRAGVVLPEVLRTRGTRVVALVTVAGLAWGHFPREVLLCKPLCMFVYVCVGGGAILPCRAPARSCLLPLAIVAITGRGGQETPGLKLQRSPSGPMQRFLQPLRAGPVARCSLPQ